MGGQKVVRWWWWFTVIVVVMSIGKISDGAEKDSGCVKDCISRCVRGTETACVFNCCIECNWPFADQEMFKEYESQVRKQAGREHVGL